MRLKSLLGIKIYDRKNGNELQKNIFTSLGISCITTCIMKLLKIYVRITEVITSYHLMLSKELYHFHEWSDKKCLKQK